MQQRMINTFETFAYHNQKQKINGKLQRRFQIKSYLFLIFFKLLKVEKNIQIENSAKKIIYKGPYIYEKVLKFTQTKRSAN